MWAFALNICYNNIESCVLNNGWSTDFFKLERGVRQGCPLLPYLFVLGVEVLAEKIRKNETIKGIMVFKNEIKVRQYADDTILILGGSKESQSDICFTSSGEFYYGFRPKITQQKNRSSLDQSL